MTQSAIKANSFQNNLSAFQFSSNLAKADEETQQFLRVNARAARNVQPDVSGTDFRVVANEQKAIKRFVKVTDPDNDSIVKYRFRDLTSGKDSGFFSLAGTRFAQDKWFVIDASKLKDLFYVAGKTVASETIQVEAFDGSLWSGVASLIASTFANNNAPIVRAAFFDIRVGASASVEDVFDWRDEDKNTIKKYRFTDTNRSPISGFLTRNGVRVPAKTTITVNAANLDSIGYQAGDRAHAEFISVQAFDGKFWSNPSGIRVETLDVPILAPETDRYVDEYEKIKFIDLFKQVDAVAAASEFEIFDSTTTSGSGELVLGNTPLGPGIHKLTDFQLENLFFRGGNGDQRWLDEIYVRANNGLYFGEWIKVDIRSESVNKAALQIGGLLGPNGPKLSWRDFMTGNTITYSFMNVLPDYQDEEVDDGTFRPLTAINRRLARGVFDILEAQIGLDFAEVSDQEIAANGEQGGKIRIGGMFDLNKGYSGFAYFPGAYDPLDIKTQKPGDIYINFPLAGFPPVFVKGSFVRGTLIHEIGHALGLKHSFERPVVLPPLLDTTKYSVMSYTGTPIVPLEPSSHMIYDLLALQDLYGTRDDINAGNSSYQWSPTRADMETIWDPSGIDTFNVSNQSFGTIVDLRSGAYSSIGEFENVAIALGTIIENAKGSQFGDELIGNEHSNRLEGNDGSDTLDGGSDDDYLLGGAQNDTYIFRLAGGDDIINEQGKGGVDALEIRIEWNAFDSFPEDLTFKRLGKDLQVNLNIDNDPLNGSIIIKNMGTAASSVETLRLFNRSGNVIPGIGEVDLTSIWAGAKGADQHFKLSGGSSAFGLLASPV